MWSQCNTCSCYILSKDRDQHSCTGNETSPVSIRAKTLSANHLKPYSGDLNGVDPVKLNNLLFLHESVFGLCDLILGDFVRITSPDLANGAPIVRVAWPVVNQSAANGVVFVTEQGEWWQDVCKFLVEKAFFSHCFFRHFFKHFQSYERRGKMHHSRASPLKSCPMDTQSQAG